MQKNQTGTLSSAIHKTYLEVDKDLNIVPEIAKLPVDSIGKKVRDIGFSNNFLDMIPKVKATKSKMNILHGSTSK